MSLCPVLISNINLVFAAKAMVLLVRCMGLGSIQSIERPYSQAQLSQEKKIGHPDSVQCISVLPSLISVEQLLTLNLLVFESILTL